jgi:hypothetical protein
MFRELEYGLRFFLSAVAGSVAAFFVFIPMVRGGTPETRIYEDVRVIVLGAICGSVAWLTYRYTYLWPPPR